MSLEMAITGKRTVGISKKGYFTAHEEVPDDIVDGNLDGVVAVTDTKRSTE